jgi:hypothetical protein
MPSPSVRTRTAFCDVSARVHRRGQPFLDHIDSVERPLLVADRLGRLVAALAQEGELLRGGSCVLWITSSEVGAVSKELRLRPAGRSPGLPG